METRTVHLNSTAHEILVSNLPGEHDARNGLVFNLTDFLCLFGL